MAQLLIFDWDWTLARGENATQEKPFRHREPYVWMEAERGRNRGEVLEWLHYEDGYEIAICTNQGGISYGFQDYEETEAAIWELLRDLDWPIPLLICPYHPNGKCAQQFNAWEAWRKPNTGMLERLWLLFPDVKTENVTVVGDREEDMQAAKAAGFKFEWADAFFKHVDEAMLLDDINEHVAADDYEEHDNAPPTGDDFPF